MHLDLIPYSITKSETYIFRYVLPLFILDVSSLTPTFLIFFTGFAPSHRCHIEACESDPPQFNSSSWTEFAIPGPEQEDGTLAKMGKLDECKMYRTIDDTKSCVASNFNITSPIACDSFFKKLHKIVPKPAYIVTTSYFLRPRH